MIKLGRKGKDKITGFEGIITGRAQYIYSCDQYCILSPAKDGAIKESSWFDEGCIEITGLGILPEEVRVEKPGGPNRDMPKIKGDIYGI